MIDTNRTKFSFYGKCEMRIKLFNFKVTKIGTYSNTSNSYVPNQEKEF